MNEFRKLMFISLCMTLIVSVIILTIHNTALVFDRRKKFEENKSLLKLIANDGNLSKQFKEKFFESFDKNYVSTYEGQNFNQIFVESLLEAIKTIDNLPSKEASQSSSRIPSNDKKL